MRLSAYIHSNTLPKYCLFSNCCPHGLMNTYVEHIAVLFHLLCGSSTHVCYLTESYVYLFYLYTLIPQ